MTKKKYVKPVSVKVPESLKHKANQRLAEDMFVERDVQQLNTTKPGRPRKPPADST